MVPDEIFANPGSPQVYDQHEGDRTDLDAYMANVRVLGPRGS
ncbi:MAG: hypothetical protein QNJ90_15135 [Planctomycetota bacterium]|nr:hypothetical protein [Planctomycetota bacterium]